MVSLGKIVLTSFCISGGLIILCILETTKSFPLDSLRQDGGVDDLPLGILLLGKGLINSSV